MLIHGGLLADENEPIAREPALTDRYKVINYHRRGFAGSTHREPKVRVTIQEQVADCLALLRHLGVQRVHVVGHSLGGVIGIQLALDAPAAVNSLAVMEPAIMGAIAWAEAASNPDAARNQEAFIPGMRKVQAVYETGDRRATLETFLSTRAGEFVRDVLEFLTRTGESEQAVKDADTFIEVEMPAAFAWQFTPQDAGRITVRSCRSLAHTALSVRRGCTKPSCAGCPRRKRLCCLTLTTRCRSWTHPESPGSSATLLRVIPCRCLPESKEWQL